MTHKIKPEVKKLYDETKVEYPDIDKRMVEMFLENMPEKAMMVLDMMKYGCHLISEEMAKEGISHLKTQSGSKVGERWTLEDITRVAKGIGIVIDDQEYYPLDLYFQCLAKYGDYGSFITDPTLIVKIAHADLTDKDDVYGNPSERAYHMCAKLIEKYIEKE